jgi:hypothetical protein
MKYLSQEVNLGRRFNLLKPTGYVMHQLVLHSTIVLSAPTDLCHLYYKLIGFYNGVEKCLLCGTNWLFNPLAPEFGI